MNSFLDCPPDVLQLLGISFASSYLVRDFYIFLVQKLIKRILPKIHKIKTAKPITTDPIYTVVYQGNLTASLAIPSYEKPIDSLQDLYVAVSERGFKPVVSPSSSNEFIFKVRNYKTELIS